MLSRFYKFFYIFTTPDMMLTRSMVTLLVQGKKHNTLET